MDQQLEIRMLGLSIFLAVLILPFLFIKKMGMLKQSDLKILKNPLVLIYAGFILVIGISVFWATNPSEAFYEFLKRAVFFILFLYLIIFVFPKEESRLALVKAFVLFSLIIAVTGIFQIVSVLSGAKYGIDSLYLITGNFAQKNIFSEVLFITFAFCVYGVFSLHSLWKRTAIAGTLLTLLLIAFLMTRAIWAGFFISLIFTLLLYLFYLNKTQMGTKLKSGLRYFVIIFTLVMLGVVVIALTDNNKTLQHQISNAFDFKQGNTFHRLNLWKKSVALAGKHPLLGVGAGNWKIDILQYDLQVTTVKGRIMPDRAHNDYIQVLVENGIIGLSLFLMMLIFLLYFCIKILKKHLNLNDSLFVLILFFVLTGYLIDSFFAFPRERIELQIFLNIIIAAIVFEYNKKYKKVEENKSQYSIRPFAFIIFAVLILTAFAAYKRLQAEVGMTKIYANYKVNNNEQIVKISNEIYSPFSTISPFCDPILQIRAISMYKANYELDKVLQTYDLSLKDSPYHLETLNGLSIIHKNEKNYTKALEYNDKALQYAPTDVRAKVLRTDILLSMNKMEEAYQNLRNMDTSNKNADYKKVLNYILLNKTGKMMSHTKNVYFSMQLSKAVEQPGFLFGIYCKSIKKNEEFEKTLLDTVFALCDLEKIRNDQSLQLLKLKYKIKGN